MHVVVTDLDKKPYREAISQSVDDTILINPENIDAHVVKAIILLFNGEFDLALFHAKKAVGFNPCKLGSYITLANVYGAMGDFETEFKILKETYKKGFGLAALNWNYSISLLRHKNFKLGWDLYRWRKVYLPKHMRFLQPDWNGRPVKTLLVWSEQGLGDQIMMFRFVKELKKRGLAKTVILECAEELYTLFCANSEGIDQIYVREGDANTTFKFDAHCSIMDLCYYLKINPDEIEGSQYLTTDLSIRNKWDVTLKDIQSKIGLCWRGSSSHPNDSKRSASLVSLTKLSKLGQLIGLVKDGTGEEVPHGMQLLNVVDGLINAEYTASLIQNMDYVITVDSFIAHLSGALGIPTFLLLPKIGEWRWADDDNFTYWYKSVILCRQTEDGDWSVPINKVLKDRKCLTQRGQPSLTLMES